MIVKGRCDECGMENVEVMISKGTTKVKKPLCVINVDLLMGRMRIKNSCLFSNMEQNEAICSLNK